MNEEKYEYDIEKINILKKCCDDIIFFAENYFYTRSYITGKYELVKLKPHQKDALLAIQDNRKYMQLACRQSGKTLILEIYALWLTTFKEHKKIMYTSTNYNMGEDFLKRIMYKHSMLPDWFRSPLLQVNKRYLEFENGSAIMAASYSNEDDLRGRAIDVVLIDELYSSENIVLSQFGLSSYINLEQFWVCMIPMLNHKQSKLVVVGTPDINGSFFHNLYETVRVGGKWVIHKNNYSVLDRDYLDIIEFKNLLGEDNFKREYCAEFV